ncbi:MAG: hypothetical protein RMK57_15665 [Bryobacterales bacterium]|nr:FecR domain-containing protein [Bryobacteraceae bacterium]MDW8355959.1 hypothetical protein [Bryobacterales bacterium]
MRLRRWVCGVGLSVAAALAQTVISARSGLIHYTEGDVLMGSQRVEPKFGHFPQLEEGQVLRTEEGRAEVLLNPGVFLRLGEHSGIRMVSTLLTAPRVELLSGSLVIESADLDKDTSVLIRVRDAEVRFRKKGIFRLNADPPELRVFDGQAVIERGKELLEVKEGRKVGLEGELAVAKFDRRLTDALDRWSMRRAEYLSMASVYAARSLGDAGAGWRWDGGWAFNPYFGMFTYVPSAGIYISPYGYRFYSPERVYALYEPPHVVNYSELGRWDASRGYPTIPQTSAGTSGTLAAGAAAPTTSSESSSAPIQRPSGTAGGRDH